MKRQLFIRQPIDAAAVMQIAYRIAAELLALGDAVRVSIENLQPTRTVQQNAKLHALCQDVSKRRQWAGRWLDAEGWKRLFVDAWARETGRTQSAVVPSLDGQSVVAVGLQTRRMTIDELCELIDWIEAWSAQQ